MQITRNSLVLRKTTLPIKQPSSGRYIFPHTSSAFRMLFVLLSFWSAWHSIRGGTNPRLDVFRRCARSRQTRFQVCGAGFKQTTRKKRHVAKNLQPTRQRNYPSEYATNGNKCGNSHLIDDFVCVRYLFGMLGFFVPTDVYLSSSLVGREFTVYSKENKNNTRYRHMSGTQNTEK